MASEIPTVDIPTPGGLMPVPEVLVQRGHGDTYLVRSAPYWRDTAGGGHVLYRDAFEGSLASVKTHLKRLWRYQYAKWGTMTQHQIDSERALFARYETILTEYV